MRFGIIIHHTLVVKLILVISFTATYHFVTSTDDELTKKGGKLRSKTSPLNYGTDISFPTHYAVSTNYPWLPHNTDPKNNPTPEEYKNMPIQPLGDRLSVYNEYIDGCKKFFSGDYCESNEEERLNDGLEQAVLMKNFTENGFTKLRLPTDLFSRIQSFWTRNRKTTEEESINFFINSWACPTMMVNFESQRMDWGDDITLTDDIRNAVRHILEEWTGLQLKDVALYGIRVYSEGSILISHVDDLPRVASAIINVDQDVDEDWPLEVIGHDGRAYNVTSKPGDLILYESHSTFHSRPFALKGRFYANIFVHFEPTGYSKDGEYLKPIHKGAPLYLAHGDWSELKEKFLKENGDEDEDDDDGDGDGDGDGEDDDENEESVDPTEATEAHNYAYSGDLKSLKQIASRDVEMLHQRDVNGWQPIHEAARSGHKKIVEFLLQHGADVNSFTEDTGGSVLYWALEEHSEDHPVIKFLKSKGAISVEPEPEL